MFAGLAVAPVRAAQPLTVDDADVVAVGDAEITVGHFRGASGQPRTSAGLVDVAAGVAPGFEFGWSADLDRWRSAEHALALKGVTRHGAEDGRGQGLAVSHAWARGADRELAVSGLLTRFLPWGGFDTNLGLAWPMDGSKLGTTSWFAGQSVRYAHESGPGVMAELRGGGDLGSSRIDEAGYRVAATYEAGAALFALGFDRVFRGEPETTLFATVTFAIPFQR